MTTTGSDKTATIIGSGVVGGILGGIFIDAFLAIATHAPILGIWQFVASALVGPAAFSSPAYAALGFAMHFAISIVWGVLFAALALGPIPALVRRPVLGGIAYGVVVMIGMTALTVIKHVVPAPTGATSLVTPLLAHTLFFGVPVALYVASVAKKFVAERSLAAVAPAGVAAARVPTRIPTS